MGCGWLGLPLATHLISTGYTVFGSNRSLLKKEELAQKGIVPFIIDIDTLSQSSCIADFLKTDVLIVSITSKNYSSYEVLVDFIKNSPVKKVIFISSTSVYRSENAVVTEATTVDHESPLAAIENLFLNQSVFKVAIVRFAGLFGYTRKPSNFFASKTLNDPAGFVNLIHRDDCIEIIARIIQHNVWNQIFNACADSHPTKLAFYTKVAIDNGKQPPKFDDTKTHAYKIISNEKIKQSLNFTFKHNDLMNLIADE